MKIPSLIDGRKGQAMPGPGRHAHLARTVPGLLVLSSVVLFAQASVAQPVPGQVTIRAEELHQAAALVLGDEPWRYRAGDDPAWADPAVDDADWSLLRPDFDPDSLAEGIWNGIGWFRLRLHVAPDLRNTTLAMHLFHLGASEVYLDGERVGGYGVIGAAAAAYEPFSPKGLPQGLPLDGQADHVLAVRYAYRPESPLATIVLDGTARHPEGFFMLLKPLNTGIQTYYNRALVAPFMDGLVLGMLVLLGGLHLLLYVLDPQERAHVYFSVFAFCFAIGDYVTISPVGASPMLRSDIAHGLWVGEVAMTTALIALVAVYHQVFYQRLTRIFWLVAGLGVTALFTTFVIPLQKLSWIAFVPLVFLEGLRTTGLAIWRKKEGAWILGTGTLVLIGAMGILILIMAQNPSYSETGFLLAGYEDLNRFEVDGMLVVTFFIVIPVAMSVLLARRFSQTSRNLRAQLEKVRTLSEQTIAQEREKQALIAGQKEQLEVDVAQRTAELQESLVTLKATQAQLVQQEKMASLGQLTAGIAHEIKNPLNFITNFAEVNEELADELRGDLADYPEALARIEDVLADLAQNAGLIKQHGRRADGIVRSMMQHASGGSGQREPTDVNALVSEYVDLAYHGKRAQTPGFTCEIERDLGADVGTVRMIPQEIGRVVLNLVGNAFDAVSEERRAKGEEGEIQDHRVDTPDPSGTRRGGFQTRPAAPPIVTVTTRRANGQVEIRVFDNGPGIPAALREKIFEPFFTTKPTGSGTGLGLSLSYDIVTQGHGGTLTVESEDGQGATFVVTLPYDAAGTQK